MKSRHCLLAVVLVLTIGTAARADLIETIPFAASNGWAYASDQSGPVTGLYFFLGYSGAGASGFLGSPYLGPAVGEYNWLGRSPGTYDFTPRNSTDFNAFASRLTNGADETLYVGQGISLAGGNFYSGASGTMESVLFGRPAPASIDFIRLNLTGVTTSNTATGEPGQYLFEVYGQGSWEFYGTRTLTPEPASLLLLGTGLAGVAASRKLRRQRQRN